jgi:hypothetical protein
VKALSADLHPSSVGLYRIEAATMPHLPRGLSVPRLLDVYDDGNWVALVYEEVDGRHPDLPWRPDELQRVAAALAASPPAHLEPGLRRHLDRVAAEVPDLAEVVRGDALLHNDILTCWCAITS